METILFVICIVALIIFLLLALGEKNEVHKIIDLVFCAFLICIMILFCK